MTKLSPIALFTYNRLSETRRTIEALKQNQLALESDLIIFSDGAANGAVVEQVSAVREYLKTITGFKTIKLIESDENRGLANSIISGVSKVLETHDRVIVLEDDLVTTPNFLTFMNGALKAYENRAEVQSVCGYSPKMSGVNGDVYFHRRPFSWGWATWKPYWENTVFDKMLLKKEIDADPTLIANFKKICGNNVGKMLLGSLSNQNDSWFVRWAFGQYLNGNYSVYPHASLVTNIGFGTEGTHCKGINPYPTDKMDGQKRDFGFKSFEKPTPALQSQFLDYFTVKQRIKIRMKLLLHKEGRQLVWDEIRQKVPF